MPQAEGGYAHSAGSPLPLSLRNLSPRWRENIAPPSDLDGDRDGEARPSHARRECAILPATHIQAARAAPP